MFIDPVSGFSTSDVRDIDQQIVRFNTVEELIWIADGTRFPGYRVAGNFVRWDRYFGVRFGTKGGERRAYLCGHGHDDKTDPPHICDVSGQLVIIETKVLCLEPSLSFD